jgi:hypothetical protein
VAGRGGGRDGRRRRREFFCATFFLGFSLSFPCKKKAFFKSLVSFLSVLFVRWSLHSFRGDPQRRAAQKQRSGKQ